VAIPSGLEQQWLEELGRFAEGTAVHCVASEQQARALVGLDGVALVPHRLLAAVRTDGVDMLVIDEAAYLCRDSQRTKASWSLRASATKALLLTGTPARRRTSDLGALVSFVLGDKRAFHGVPLGDDWAVRVGPLVQGADDHMALPASTRRLIVCRPAGAEAALIAASLSALTAARAELARAEAAGVPGKERNRLRYVAQAAFERARLAGTDPSAMSGELASLAALVTTPAKRQALLATCSDDVPTVVCCDSAVVATAVAATLQDAGLRAAALTGALSRDQQAATVAQLGSNLDVLVVASVGQQGWNLQAASRVVHYDVPLTVAAARQREGRVRRFGGSSSEAVCLVLEGAVDTDAAKAWASASPDAAGV
jgi:rhodanese-related sulfurtransferase